MSDPGCHLPDVRPVCQLRRDVPVSRGRMIYDGICPKYGCGGRLAEARGFRAARGRFVQNPHGNLIKTKCTRCQALIGYRPAEVGQASQQRGRKQPVRADLWSSEIA